MSRLRLTPGNRLIDLLTAAPGALEADRAMRRQLVEEITPRLYSLIGVVVAGLLGCAKFVEALRGPLGPSLAFEAAHDWRALEVNVADKAVLAYTERGTLDEAAVRKRDVDELRAAGFTDKDVLLIATVIAYHNYSIRMAAAFDVLPSSAD